MGKYAFPVEVAGVMLIVGGLACFSVAVALIALGVACVVLGEVHG